MISRTTFGSSGYCLQAQIPVCATVRSTSRRNARLLLTITFDMSDALDLDGVDYLTNGLIHMGPHAPNCTYEHVHGGEIRSLTPGSNGQSMTRTEHLGDCGFGPPSFSMVRDPR